MPDGPLFTTSEFAAGLRQRYPELAQTGHDDATLVHAFLKFNPKYAPHVVDVLSGAEMAPAPNIPQPNLQPEAPPNPNAVALANPKLAFAAAEPTPPAMPVHPIKGAKRAIQGAVGVAKQIGTSLPEGAAPPTMAEAFKPYAEMVGGAMEAGAPLLGAGAVAAPIETAVGLGVGTALTEATKAVAQHFGAPPEATEFLSNAAGLLGGVAAGGAVGDRMAAKQAATDQATIAANTAARAGMERMLEGRRTAAEGRMRSELADETDLLDYEANQRVYAQQQDARYQTLLDAVAQNQKLNDLAQSMKEQPGSPFRYLDRVGAAGGTGEGAPSGPPPQLPAAPTPAGLLPPAQPDFIVAPPGENPPVPNVDVVNPGEAAAAAAPKVAISPAPEFPDWINTIGEMFGSDLENQPPPDMTPRPGEALRTKLRARQDYLDTQREVAQHMADEMGDVTYQRGRLVTDRSGPVDETYYTPPTPGSPIYWDVIGRETKSPPTRAMVTDILKAYAETGATKAKDLPEQWQSPEGYGPREFKNAYDRWIDDVRRTVDQYTRRELGRRQDLAARQAAMDAEVPDWVKEGENEPPAAPGDVPEGFEPDLEGAPPGAPGGTGEAGAAAGAAPPAGSPVGPPEPPAPATEIPRRATLFDRLAGEEGVLILNVRPGDAKGLRGWLDRQEAEHGQEPWWQDADAALQQGDTRQAWRLAQVASARSMAGAIGEDKRRQAAAAAAGETSPEEANLAAETARRTAAAHKKQLEAELGRPLPKTADMSPEGIVTFDFGGKGIPAVRAAATDLTLGKTFLNDVINSVDPSEIIKVEGNENPDLRANAQIADWVVRNADSNETLKDLMDLTGITDPVELGRQFRRAYSQWGKVGQQLSQWVQENDDLFYHTGKVSETGAPEEVGSVGALQARGVLTPDGFVKWLGGHANDADLKNLEFDLPKGIRLKNDQGELTPEAKVFARNWFRKQQKMVEIQKTIDALAKDGSAIDRATIATTIAPDQQTNVNRGTIGQLAGLSRSALIAKPSTMIRNLWSQGGRYASGIVDDVVAGTLSLATGDSKQAGDYFTRAKNLVAGAHREGTSSAALIKHPWAEGLEAIYNYKREDILGMKPSDARKTLSLLSEFPHWEAKFLGSLALEDTSTAAGTSKFQFINKITSPEVRNTLTVFNRVQEHFFRAAVFDASMRSQLESRGLDPDVELSGDPVDLIRKLGEEEVDRMVGAATAAALDYTFAAQPLPGTVPDQILDIFSRHPVFSPMMQMAFPFPRFNFVSAPRWLWDHFPLAPLVDGPLALLGAVREDSSMMLRGRMYQMLQLGKQNRTMLQLDNEIGRTEYDAAKYLGDFMKAKSDSRVAAKQFADLEKRLTAGKDQTLPGLQEDLARVTNDLHERTGAAAQAKALWKDAENRIRNLRGQREKAKKMYSGLSEAGAAKSPQEYIARLVTGGTALAAAYMIRKSAGAKGTQWFEYKVSDPADKNKAATTIDLRPYAPQVQSLFLGDILADVEEHTDWKGLSEDLKARGGLSAIDENTWKDLFREHYTGKYTEGEAMKDALDAYLSVSPAAGSTKDIIDTMTGRTSETNDISLQDAMISQVGQFLARFTNPLGTINDIRGQFSPEATPARIPVEGGSEAPSKLHELFDPSIANIPWLREKLIPTKIDPLSGEPLGSKTPLLRQAAGVNLRFENQVQQELARTGLPYGAAAPRITGDREFDNRVAEVYAGLLKSVFVPQVLENKQYQSLTPELKRDILTSVFSRVKTAAYAQVVSTLDVESAREKMLSPGQRQKIARWKKWAEKGVQENSAGMAGAPPEAPQEEGEASPAEPPEFPAAEGAPGLR